MPALLPAALPPGPAALSLGAALAPDSRGRPGGLVVAAGAADGGDRPDPTARPAGPGVRRAREVPVRARSPRRTRKSARRPAPRRSGTDAPRHPDRPAEPRPHQPALLDRVLHHLAPRPGGRYLDATFGRGGHSEAILEAATSPTPAATAANTDPAPRGGELLALDRDPAALPAAAALAEAHPGFRFRRRDFADLDAVLDEIGWARLDGILLDLGLSSPQLDGPAPPDSERPGDPAAEPASEPAPEPGRGFSFRRDEPLDMRFDPDSGGETAAQLLDRLEEREIADLLHAAGERRSRAIARRIASRRPLRTTGDLRAAVIAALGPKRGRLDPATRTFLAVRRAVNREAEALAAVLAAAPKRLAPGGTLVVIAYHSDEDRPVKHRFRELAAAAPRTADPDSTTGDPAAATEPEYEVVTRRPERPDAAECDHNRRARSARLRVLRRRLPTETAAPATPEATAPAPDAAPPATPSGSAAGVPGAPRRPLPAGTAAPTPSGEPAPTSAAAPPATPGPAAPSAAENLAPTEPGTATPTGCSPPGERSRISVAAAPTPSGETAPTPNAPPATPTGLAAGVPGAPRRPFPAEAAAPDTHGEPAPTSAAAPPATPGAAAPSTPGAAAPDTPEATASPTPRAVEPAEPGKAAPTPGDPAPPAPGETR